jgi:NAD(P)-dependent dehydrogenase (short-subunit alcohol dehydrogenase family)
MKRFEDKVLMVTGAAGDIGGAVAHRMADEGAHVFLTDIDGDKLKQRISELETNGAAVNSAVCDVTDWRSTAGMVRKAASWRGRIDLLFNNAGYQGLFEKAHAYPADDFTKVIGVNLVGVFHVFRAVSDVMVKQKSGAIVNTASMAGTLGPPNMAAYASSKAGVLGLTRTASKDVAPYNVRVNAISPAFVGPGFMWDRQVELQAAVGSQYYATDPKTVAEQMIARVPLRRYASLSEIAGVVAFLLSDDASYLTGVNVPIAGGIL